MRDDDEDEWEDDEPDEDQFDDADEPTVACHYCHREIHEDAQRCPYCERYISEEDAPRERKPWWIVLTVALCLYLVYRWMKVGP